MSLQILCPLLNFFFFFFFTIELCVIFWMLTPYAIYICKYFLLFHRLSLPFVGGFLCCAESFLFSFNLFLLFLPLLFKLDPKI